MPDSNKAPNKVKFGLKNCKYAEVTFSGNTPTFGTVTDLPGAVSLSVSRVGESYDFYADDGVYFELGNNSGYDGTLELAMIPDGFRTLAFGETKDAKGVLKEGSNAVLGHFALLFEFTGDANAVRHVLYNCTATQNDVAGNTKADSVEVQTETINIKARALPGGGEVKAKTGDATDATTYDSWFSTVYRTAT
jgi:phi13 family phage major tail protein